MLSLDEFPDLSTAESGLIRHLREGKPGEFKASDGLPTADAPPDLHIRASLVRALALRQVADVPLPDRGLRIWGALIRGDGPPEAETPGLDLEGARLPCDLALMACHVADMVLLRGAEIKSLLLDGSRLKSDLWADGLSANGYLFLRGVTCDGQIRLPGAQLGGDLDCNDATLTAMGDALIADGLSAKGGILLRGVTCAGHIRLLGAQLGANLDCDGAKFTSEDHALSADSLSAQGSVFLRKVTSAGKIRLLGARLGRDLSCVGANLTTAGHALNADRMAADGDLSLLGVTSAGEIRLAGAKVGGSLECYGAKLHGKGRSLNCDGAKIGGTWFWRAGAHAKGAIDMRAAEIGSICDDRECWPTEILLNRCRYGGFTGKGVDGAQRIDWLSRQKPQTYGDDFWPQPYEECARALREAGHVADAREVLIAKERLQRRARHLRLGRELAQAKGGYRKLGLWLQRWLSRGGDALVGGLVAYGRRPLQAAIPLVVILFLGAMIFSVAAGRGQIKPNLPQIQRTPEWVSCGQAGGWRLQGGPPMGPPLRPPGGRGTARPNWPVSCASPRHGPIRVSAR